MNFYVQAITDDPAPPPGEVLRARANQRGMTDDALATRLAIHPKTLRALLEGRHSIGVELARRLGCAFDTTPAFWLDLDVRYRATMARAEGALAPPAALATLAQECFARHEEVQSCAFERTRAGRTRIKFRWSSGAEATLDSPPHAELDAVEEDADGWALSILRNAARLDLPVARWSFERSAAPPEDRAQAGAES